MPRHARQVSGPQDEYSPHLAVPMTSSMYVQPREQLQSNYNFSMPSSSGTISLAPQQQLPSYEPYPQSTAPPVVAPVQQRPSSGAWSPDDDRQLLQARVQNLSWADIKEQYFPSKTPNACRKRHERLMERKGADDFDTRKMQTMAKEYMKMRKEIWRPLADRCGEKWSVVEHKCMSNGLKNLQSHARQASRRERNGGNSSYSGYDDDSGISGIGLTPVDELDVPYSSSDTTSSPNGPHSASSAEGYHHPNPYPSPHHLQPHAVAQSHAQLQSINGMQQQQQQQNHHHQQQQQHHPYNLTYGGYGHHYSSSSGSNASAYGQPAVEGGSGSGPFMNGGRQSSADMGIGSIINRSNGV